MGAVVLAALALAGAPSTASVQCVAMANWGEASPGQAQVWLAESVCAGLSSPRPGRRGVALLVLLHEARHLAAGMNECDVERYAVGHVGQLVARFVPSSGRAAALRAVRLTDARMSPSYREGCSSDG